MTLNAKKHPIQLVSTITRELSFKKYKDISKNAQVSCSIATGKAEHKPETDIVKCGIKSECQCKEGEDIFFNIIVEIIGIFRIDKENFPIEEITNWQEKNAPFILLPYLREQIYSLSIHAGIEPIILPMYVVPTTRSTLVKAEVKKIMTK